MRAPSERGFSLLEMVIVVAILATLAVGASLTIAPRGGAGDVRSFAAAYAALRDAAVLEQGARGLRLVPGGWQVLVPDPASGTGWQGQGAVQRLRGELRVEGRDGAIPPRPAEDPPVPDLVFLADGEVTLFTAVFIGSGRITTCRSGGLAGLVCGAP